MHNNRGMMLPGNGMNAGGMNAMNANANSNMSSMNPLGQLAQMNSTPNAHLNSMNSPNGSRLGSSSPSLAVNSPNMGLNGNRVPGKHQMISASLIFIYLIHIFLFFSVDLNQ